MSKMEDGFYQKKWFWAIVCLTILECYALSLGIDGVALSAVVASLAGLGGFAIGKKS